MQDRNLRKDYDWKFCCCQKFFEFKYFIRFIITDHTFFNLLFLPF